MLNRTKKVVIYYFLTTYLEISFGQKMLGIVKLRLKFVRSSSQVLALRKCTIRSNSKAHGTGKNKTISRSNHIFFALV